ncbi:MAG TPA: flagellar M-ring protein FliF [Roseobacter sp.]|uniref:Flagellar M-ring protein n=1 Tax=marine sediment metagenome TaxID=412755 RepID=A0A0F9QRB3_9ZZZZ|nr:flagellar M-ring protein FliF [Roseobacter sp.]HEC70320.1 flagellar M-ring protein FliF [Roseobacter sp.]|tara:strand:- start:3055 stop:4764 length:1710 start_codon:yes stop_codon:yes gene_type:complete
MQGLIENLKSLGKTKLMILAGTAAAVMLSLILGVSAVTRPDYAPLYSSLSVTSANSIEATLTNAGFSVLLSEDSSRVSVPRSDVVRARMILAETGMPVDGDPGWELFDESSGLAMNSFLQKINRLRAMEGELARSIQTLDGIASARVHLVLPDREPFSREAPAPRASIILRPESGRAVNRKQAVAVRNLVASAVASLDISNVTVLSASGETILSEGADGTGQAGVQSAKSSIEDRLSQEIQNILTARVGGGNARVHVNVELTTQREVIVEQSFDPDQQVVRSTETKSEDQIGSKDNGNVGVENNIPAALAGGGGAAGSSTKRSEADEIIKYEIGNTRREIVREAGDVRRMSVAVLVNGIYNVDGSEVVYAERNPEELARLSELVKSAVGFDDGRGDSISVDSMRFMDYSMDLGDPINKTLTDELTDNVVPIIRGILALLVVGLIMIFGVRPLLRKFTEANQLNDFVDPALSAPNAADAGALAAPVAEGKLPKLPAAEPSTSTDAGNAEAVASAGADGVEDLEAAEFVRKEGIRGNLHRKKIETIQRLADEKPQEVLRVIRSWLPAEAEA